MKKLSAILILFITAAIYSFPAKSIGEKSLDTLISKYVTYYNARDFNSYMSLNFPVSEGDIKPLDKILNRVKNSWSKPKEPIKNYSFEIRELSNTEKEALTNWYILPITPTHLISVEYDPPKGGGISGHTLHAVQKGESWYLQMPYIYPANPNKKANEPDVTFKAGFSSGWPYSWKFNNLNYKSLEISLWKNNKKNKTIITNKDLLAPGNIRASFSFNKATLSGELNNPKNSYLILPYAYWQGGKNSKGLSDWVKLEYGVFSNLNVFKTFSIKPSGSTTMATFSITNNTTTNNYEIRATYAR